MRPSQRRRWKSNDEPSPRERRDRVERGEWMEEDEATTPARAPIVFRILAWTTLVIIFFAVGYGATSLAFRWLDSRASDRGAARTPPNLSASPEETLDILARTPGQASATPEGSGIPPDPLSPMGDGDILATISIPDGNTFQTRQIRCTNALQEDRIKQVLSAYMDAMKENQMLGAGASDLNIFQSGEWLYLNMNGAFLESLKALGAERSRIMLTGMVKTMTDNFAPINRIKFYVDGREVTDRDPVDLTSPWGISARSS